MIHCIYAGLLVYFDMPIMRRRLVEQGRMAIRPNIAVPGLLPRQQLRPQIIKHAICLDSDVISA